MRQAIGIFALFAAGFLVLQFTGRLEEFAAICTFPR